MFGRSRAVVFDPYRGRRSGLGVPRWLLWLLLGAATGIAGVVYVQRQVLPPRLSADESVALRQAFGQADAERQRLATELDVVNQRLKLAQAESQRLADEAQVARTRAEALQVDLEAAVDALPPDPRDGAVAVRSARFAARDGELVYDVVLTRDQAGGEPLDAVMQVTVAGASASKSRASAALPPVAAAIGRLHVARGSLALPAGFKPRQATIRVLDREGGRQLGVRVLPVR